MAIPRACAWCSHGHVHGIAPGLSIARYTIGKHASRRPLTGAGKVHRPQRYHREKPRPRRYDHQEEPKKHWSCSFPVEECYRKNLCRPDAACTCHSAKNECESRFRDNCQTDNVSFPIMVLAIVLSMFLLPISMLSSLHLRIVSTL